MGSSLQDITSNSASPKAEVRTISLWKRIVAFTYDSLIVIALLMAATLISLLATGGEPIFPEDGLRYSIFQVYLGFVITAYFVSFWHFGGQTIGMKAWNMRLIDLKTGKPPSFGKALLRFILALLWCGIGMLPALWRKDRATVYDLWMGTGVFRV